MKLVKNTKALLCLLFFATWVNLFPQVNPVDFLKKAKADYAVPDAPAFKILQTDPSTVLRPTSSREVAVTVANLFKGGKIPDNYALEISPGLLLANSLDNYKKNPLCYRARISFATKTMENSAKHIGLGVRLTLYDDTDLRLNTNYEEKLIKIGKTSDDLNSSCADELADKIADDNFSILLDECMEAKKDYISKKINALRDSVKEKNWNAPIVEMGFATSALSGDSLAKSLSVNSYQFWFSAALPLGKEGQIIAGLNGGVSKNDKDELKKSEGSLGVRGYYGTNNQKLFLEADIKVASEMFPSYSLNIGYEYNVTNGLWADISLGLIKKDGSKFVSSSSLNFRFATPE